MTTLLIDAIMSRHVCCVAPDTPMPEVLGRLESQGLSCLVISEGRLPLGVFSEWDAVGLIANAVPIDTTPVAQHMHPPLLLHGGMDVREAYVRMGESRQWQAVIVDHEGLIDGLVTEGDLLHLIHTEHLVELKSVSEVMLHQPLTFPPDATIKAAARAMTRTGSGTALVVVDARPVGILSERDMARLVRRDERRREVTLAEVMSSPVRTVTEDLPVHEASRLMDRTGIRRLAVVDSEGLLRGLITRHEVVRTLEGRYVQFLRDLVAEHSALLNTTRKRLELAEERLIHRGVMSQVHDAVCVIDPQDGRLLEVNDSACTLLGHPREALLEMHAWQISDAIIDLPQWRAFCAEIRDDDPHLLITHHRAADGSMFPVETSFRRVTRDRRSFIITVARDLRERALNEARLTESRARYRALFEVMNHGVAVYQAVDDGADFIFTDLNPAAERIEGLCREDVIGQRVTHLFPGIAAMGLLDVFRRVWRAGGRERLTSAHYADERIDGWRDNIVYRLESGEIVAVYEDITEHQQAELRLREGEAEMRAIIENLPLMVFMKDAEHLRFVRFNQAGERLLGLSRTQLIGRGDEDFFPPEQARHFIENDRRVLSSHEMVDIPVEPIQTTHGLRYLHTRKIAIRDESGAPRFLLGISEDITRQRAMEERLRMASAVFESTHEGVMVADREGRIAAINRAFTHITGYTETDVIGHTPSILKSGRHGDTFYRVMWSALRQDGHWQGEIWNRRKSGEIFPELLTISAVRDEQGQLTHYVGVFADISRIKQSEEQLERLAHYDPLTQLPNRLLLQSRLTHSLEIAQRGGRQLAVMFIDLDRFKNVNDSLGHRAGDELLTQIAARLRGRLRDEDTLARLGGDEFVVVLSELRNPSEAAGLAQQIIQILTQHPFRLMGDHDVYIGASIGISLFPSDGCEPNELIRNADTAMYQAKSAGRNTYRFYTEELTRRAHERLSLETQLRQALESGELTVHYQPQVDVRSGRLIGFEALARWQHPQEGLISPARFIPLAEETGLIVPLGDQVLQEAMRQAVAWHRSGHTHLRMAVNLSSRQFQKIGLVASLRQHLERSGMAPDRLELELTESLLLEHGKHGLSVLGQLRDMGIRLSIDDFGTGYSSLAYLKRLPISKLKIDQGFVQGIPHDGRDMEIAATIIAMARNLHLEVLAEGVETEAQLAFLRARECDAYQGYLFSPPMPPEAIDDVLAADGLLQTASDGR
ncbi:MAG: EAL domain-containing protein [Pseudomonadota bacterium]